MLSTAFKLMSSIKPALCKRLANDLTLVLVVSGSRSRSSTVSRAFSRALSTFGSSFLGSTFGASSFLGSDFFTTFLGSTFLGSTFLGSTFLGSTFLGSVFFTTLIGAGAGGASTALVTVGVGAGSAVGFAASFLAFLADGCAALLAAFFSADCPVVFVGTSLTPRSVKYSLIRKKSPGLIPSLVKLTIWSAICWRFLPVAKPSSTILITMFFKRTASSTDISSFFASALAGPCGKPSRS